MKQCLALTSILVDDYDTAIDFYVNSLGFDLIEDTLLEAARFEETELGGNAETQAAKRWVVVRPKGAIESGLLLAQAASEEQKAGIGNQCSGRVFLFLKTDDFWRDYRNFKLRGVEFVEKDPREEPYGTVSVFTDCSGNKWDLIEHR